MTEGFTVSVRIHIDLNIGQALSEGEYGVNYKRIWAIAAII